MISPYEDKKLKAIMLLSERRKKSDLALLIEMLGDKSLTVKKLLFKHLEK